jgi:hypothetical protein
MDGGRELGTCCWGDSRDGGRREEGIISVSSCCFPGFSSVEGDWAIAK